MSECSECGKPVLSKGLCRSHYYKSRREARKRGDFKFKRIRMCVVPGCGREDVALGYCNKHRARLRRGKLIGKDPSPGKERHPLYGIYKGMMRRCYQASCRNYKNYGARGIVVCDVWRESFEKFIEDMGPRPTLEHSLDRIDVNGNYEQGNVRWATRWEQARNRRNTASAADVARVLELVLTIGNRSEISRQSGVDYAAVLYILKNARLEAKSRAPEVVPAVEWKSIVKEKPRCSIEGCGRDHMGRGYCRKHYQIYILRPELVEFLKNRSCQECAKSIDPDRPINAKFCDYHCQAAWHRKNGCYKTDALISLRGPCSVEGCDGPSRARGMCQMHYDRYVKHGEGYQPKPREPKFCKETGCDKPHASRGYCINHYKIRWRAGEFGKPPPEPPTTG